MTFFLDPLELNSVETEVTAAESPWQAGITEANGRAFTMVFKKMLDSTNNVGQKRFVANPRFQSISACVWSRPGAVV